MISNAVAAFVGCFSALLVMAEIKGDNKLIRYFAALVVVAVAKLFGRAV